MIKLIVLILIHDIILANGQTLIKQAINTAGDVRLATLRGMLYFIRFCATHIKIWSGLALNTTSLAIWLVILSFTDLSLAYPLDSLHYIVITLFAKLFLKERVDRIRWAGVILVVIGVSVVGIR